MCSLCPFSPVIAPLYSALVVSTVLQGSGGHFAGLKGECWPLLPRGYLLTGAALCPLGAQGSPNPALWAATHPPGQQRTGSQQGASETGLVFATASGSQLQVVQLLLQVQSVSRRNAGGCFLFSRMVVGRKHSSPFPYKI